MENIRSHEPHELESNVQRTAPIRFIRYSHVQADQEREHLVEDQRTANWPFDDGIRLAAFPDFQAKVSDLSLFEHEQHLIHLFSLFEGDRRRSLKRQVDDNDDSISY